MGKVDTSNARIINLVSSSMPDGWQDRIPTATADNFKEVGLALTSSEYEMEYNTFLMTLYNKIGLTIFARNELSNPLAFLKNGSFSLGDTVEEIAIDVITGTQYDAIGEPDQFKKSKNPPVSMFHKRNREMKYKTTIQEGTMSKAFQRENGLYELINMIIFQLYNSDTLDQYIFSKEMFSEYRHGVKPTGVALQTGTQIVSTPMPVDATTSAEFYKTMKLTVARLLQPSSLFNAQGLTIQNRRDDLCCFMWNELEPILDVEILQKAFNPQKLSFEVPFVNLDDFGSKNDDVLAVIADKQFLRVMQNKLEMTQSYNAEGLYRNVFLHDWQTYMASYFRNVVYIVKE